LADSFFVARFGRSLKRARKRHQVLRRSVEGRTLLPYLGLCQSLSGDVGGARARGEHGRNLFACLGKRDRRLNDIIGGSRALPDECGYRPVRELAVRAHECLALIDRRHVLRRGGDHERDPARDEGGSRTREKTIPQRSCH
jgi:hypothetical protein